MRLKITGGMREDLKVSDSYTVVMAVGTRGHMQ